jgi:aspartate/methionine/tyrosine aminotransferase
MRNTEAQELNTAIEHASPALFGALSKKGKEIYFPKKGILSQSKEAAGKKINATIGIATADTGEALHLSEISRLVGLGAKEIYEYAPGCGVKELRDLWREEILHKNPALAGVELTLPVATAGLTHALSVAGYLFIDDGDTLIMPALFWENYELIFRNGFGAALTTYPLFQDGDFNIRGLKECLAQKGRKIVLLNFPNNPTGYTPTVKEAREIVQVITDAAEKEPIVVLVDDAYFGLSYEDGVLEGSIFAMLAKAHRNILAVKIDGISKEEYAWGLRVGFLTFASLGFDTKALEALTDKAAGVIRGSISNVSNLSQQLIIKAMRASGYAKEKSAHKALLQERYKRVKETLLGHPEYLKYFEVLPFNSGYFMCVRIASPNNAETVRQKMLAEYGVGVVASNDVLRIAFSSTPCERIAELFAAMYQSCGGK